MEKLRIAFAYDNAFPWFNGGVEVRRFHIMKKLADAGNDVHCFTMLREGMPSKEFVYKGIKYHCCGIAMPKEKMYIHGRRNISWPIKYAVISFFKLFRYRFDLIDADAFPFLHIPFISIYAFFTHAKFVVTWHEVWTKEYWKRYLGPFLWVFGYFAERLSSRLTKIYIANSEETKRRLVKEFGVSASSVLAFPAAISSDEMHVKKPKRKNSFLTIGRLVPEKRIDMSIMAIDKSGAGLTVVGSGPEENNLKELAKELGLERKIVFRQRVGRRALFRIIMESKGLLMFSAREGLSIVTIEAMVLGTPVFVVKSTILPKEVKRLCIKIDERNLVKSIKEVLRNYSKYEEKARSIKGIALREFSADMAPQFYMKLMSLLGK
ncbi:MAG: glycosyltransferase family 4 protein [Candidatus Micrarchaeia archaeon]